MKDAPETPLELRARALRLLARREHSREELRRKLASRVEAAEMLNAVLDSLESKKQLSDERFSSERAHILSRKYGAARIRQDLKARGIGAELVAAVSAEGDTARAAAILARKYRAPATTPKERARRMRFLQSRGFSHESIRKVLSSDADDDALIP
ncbi:MAG: recombination regulator RecX [Burkholderiales bacterium]